MPARDGTGPIGEGPLTGRGLGPCGGGRGFRRGFGRRRSLGFRCFTPRPMTKEEEKAALESEREMLEEDLKDIKKRLEEKK